MSAAAAARPVIAVLGNPNAGKTSVFNALTGLRHMTANYPGVTVEKKSGVMTLPQGEVVVLDLPGSYSLLPRSLDEQVVHDVLLGLQSGTPPPHLIVHVIDASNLERNLYLALQVLELGLPTVVALNMWDLVLESGVRIDLARLEALLGVPCIPVIARTRWGIDRLKAVVQERLRASEKPRLDESVKVILPDAMAPLVERLAGELQPLLGGRAEATRAEAVRLISDPTDASPLYGTRLADRLRQEVGEGRAGLEASGVAWAGFEPQARYRVIEKLCAETAERPELPRVTVSDRLDAVFTHKFWGLLCFIGLMALVFQSIFSWAGAPMAWIERGVRLLGEGMASVLPEGSLRSLVIDGVIAGVGNVVIFLPQIFLLFFFIALFEDFGYMARAAFVLDRVMKRVGLNGKAFLPLLSSFACAVPGIMATRTIEDRNSRMATILVAPLMSCSARLPVYTLMIGAFIPATPLFGVFNLQGVTLLGLYLFGIAAGLGMAALFRGTLLRGEKTPFIFELPPYRVPDLRNVVLTMWDRGKEFLIRAGSIIVCLSTILWFLVSYPNSADLERRYEQQRVEARQELAGASLEQRLNALERDEAGEAIRASFAGQAGRMIEPLIRPLGFDWKIGIGLIASFSAREVLVSTLAIVYNVGEQADEHSVDLVSALQSERDYRTGEPLYSPLTAISLMVFFVLACQCMSTVAVVRRETNSWRWPIFMVIYMTALAWVSSFVVYQGGRLAGWG